MAAPAAAAVLPPDRPGWWQTLWAVIAGSIVAGAGWLVLLLALGTAHLLPGTSHDAPGHGWPWRIDGLWSFGADLGPLLGVGFSFAAATSMYLERRTGVRPLRWPLATVAAPGSAWWCSASAGRRSPTGRSIRSGRSAPAVPVRCAFARRRRS